MLEKALQPRLIPLSQVRVCRRPDACRWVPALAEFSPFFAPCCRIMQRKPGSYQWDLGQRDKPSKILSLCFQQVDPEVFTDA